MNRGDFMITASGREHYLDPAEPSLNEIDVGDIASALAQLNRFTGHTLRPYSVAEHSLLVSELAHLDAQPATLQLACLLHDAHEAYVGDISSPLKEVVGSAWTYVERRHADAVRRHFGVSSTFIGRGREITRYDLVALATERAQLTRFNPLTNRLWPVLDRPGQEIPPAIGVDLMSHERETTSWREWKQAFLERFFQLHREISQALPPERAQFHA